MKYTREQIEELVEHGDCCPTELESIVSQLLSENDALRDDAERWSKARNVISAENQLGRARFVFNMLEAPFNVMRGSVAEHFTKAIDAARKPV